METLSRKPAGRSVARSSVEASARSCASLACSSMASFDRLLRFGRDRGRWNGPWLLALVFTSGRSLCRGLGWIRHRTKRSVMARRVSDECVNIIEMASAEDRIGILTYGSGYKVCLLSPSTSCASFLFKQPNNLHGAVPVTISKVCCQRVKMRSTLERREGRSGFNLLLSR